MMDANNEAVVPPLLEGHTQTFMHKCAFHTFQVLTRRKAHITAACAVRHTLRHCRALKIAARAVWCTLQQSS